MSRARIRTIKPEFWTDSKNLESSDSCALFYIALWNFCDDEGKHRLDYMQLSAETGGRWDRGKIKRFIISLTKNGQILQSRCGNWLRVRHWSHQLINRPTYPRIKADEIQWLADGAEYRSESISLSPHAVSYPILCYPSEIDKNPKQQAGREKKFDLESLYLRYPRKIGKSAGMKKLSSQILTQSDYDDLNKAIDNYAYYVKKHATEEKFIKHFSSFVSHWRDWIEAEPKDPKRILKPLSPDGGI